MSRPRTPLNLSEVERDTLTMWVRAGTSEQRMVRRAKIILFADDGLTWEEISERTGHSVNTGLEWLRRFRAERLEGLKDRPRPGAPTTYGPVEKVAVTALACSKPPEGYTNWSQRHLAQVTGMSGSTVNRVLNEAKIKPHRIDGWCGKSPDPEFEKKQADISGSTPLAETS